MDNKFAVGLETFVQVAKLQEDARMRRRAREWAREPRGHGAPQHCTHDAP